MHNKGQKKIYTNGRLHVTKKIALPVMIAVTVAGFLFLVSILIHQNYYANKWAKHEASEAYSVLEKLISMEVSMLEAAIDTISVNRKLIDIFLDKDRAQLLEETRELYFTLKQNHNVTHFYFHSLDKTNFLRVHHPRRYGDRIDRLTMKNSVETRQVTSGLELGPLGTYTLRVVKPWFHESQIIGYLELGMEVNHLFAELHLMTGTDIAVFLSKSYMDREQWINNKDFLGQEWNWNQLPDYVLASHHGEAEDQWLQEPDSRQSGSLFTLKGKNLIETFPLLDAYNRHVGNMQLKVDVTGIRQEAINFAIIGSCIIAFGLFSVIHILLRYSRLVEKKLNDETIEKEFYLKRSKRDGLTKLFNQNEFYSILKLEFGMATRSKTHLSLIMMDIDHFKQVNDQYGHRIGDFALKSIAYLLSTLMRGSDYLARYGGEEFIITLTDTGKEEACVIAERFRQVISEYVIQYNEKTLTVTASFGVATFPGDAFSYEALVENADNAMYLAKKKGRNRVEAFISKDRQSEKVVTINGRRPGSQAR